MFFQVIEPVPVSQTSFRMSVWDRQTEIFDVKVFECI